MATPDAAVSNPGPAEILQNLIQFDTTNPPGNEKPCIDYIRTLLEQAGIACKTIGMHDDRPNLIARIKGKNAAPPLLVYGHVDVVTANTQAWRYPPFSGRQVDGYIWGRGALDMKGAVAMMISALLKTAEDGFEPAGDIVFAALADEEAGGNCGAKFLVEKHPEEFSGISYAIGEFGGASMYFDGRTFYPVQVSEKQVCWLRAIIRGTGGHGSMPIRGGAMATLGQLLCILDRQSLPVRITPVARQMVETFVNHVSFPTNAILRHMLNPRLTDIMLTILGERGKTFSPLLHNTVSPTIVSGGDKVNVIPSEIVVNFDGRIVPGCKPDDLLEEMRHLTNGRVHLDVMRYDPGPGEPDMGMFDLLADVLKSADPEGVPVPLLLPGVTDARFFSRLGIQTYGFTPMRLPKNFDFFSTIHNADERVPVEAVEFGADAISELIRRYGA